MSDWTSEMVKFKKDMTRKDAIRTETFTADQEWFLCSHVDTEPTKTENTPRSSKNDYPLYNISLHVKRKNGYYLWNIAMIIVRTYLVSITVPEPDLERGGQPPLKFFPPLGPQFGPKISEGRVPQAPPMDPPLHKSILN